MATMYGADANALEALASRMRSDAAELDRIRVSLRSGLHSSPWRGPNADRFRHDWDGPHTARLVAAAAALRTAAERLASNAVEQRSASTARSGGDVGRGFGGGGGGAWGGAMPAVMFGAAGVDALSHLGHGILDSFDGVFKNIKKGGLQWKSGWGWLRAEGKGIHAPFARNMGNILKVAGVVFAGIDGYEAAIDQRARDLDDPTLDGWERFARQTGAGVATGGIELGLTGLTGALMVAGAAGGPAGVIAGAAVGTVVSYGVHGVLDLHVGSMTIGEHVNESAADTADAVVDGARYLGDVGGDVLHSGGHVVSGAAHGATKVAEKLWPF